MVALPKALKFVHFGCIRSYALAAERKSRWDLILEPPSLLARQKNQRIQAPSAG